MKITVDLIKTTRESTGAGVMEVKRALNKAGGDVQTAKKILREKGSMRAERKAYREASAGLIHAYIHAGGQIGSLVEVNCETDFVAKTTEFRTLCQEIAMQITAMNPKNLDELVNQEYIRDSSKSIQDLVKEVIAKTGENIVIKRFSRYEVGTA